MSHASNTSLKRKDIPEIYQKYLDRFGRNEDAEEKLRDFLEVEDLDDVALNPGNRQRLVLIAANFRKEVDRGCPVVARTRCAGTVFPRGPVQLPRGGAHRPPADHPNDSGLGAVMKWPEAAHVVAHTWSERRPQSMVEFRATPPHAVGGGCTCGACTGGVGEDKTSSVTFRRREPRGC